MHEVASTVTASTEEVSVTAPKKPRAPRKKKTESDSMV